MDEMEMYEIEPLVSNIHKKNKDSWELTRFLSYIMAQVNSSKQLNLEDIMKFSWDEVKESTDTSISDSLIERLRNKAKQYLNKK